MTPQEVPAELAPEFRASYQAYLAKPVLTREILAAKVRRYLGTISSAAAREQLDIATASALGAGLLRILRECEDQDLGHVQAAVTYFLESDDEEPDLTSPQGFDDDAQVFNAVCSHLGLEDLRVNLL